MYFHTHNNDTAICKAENGTKLFLFFLMVMSIYYTNQEFWQFLNYHIKIIFIFIHLDYFNYKDLKRLNCRNQLLLAHSSNSLGSSYSKRIESLNQFSLKSEFSDNYDFWKARQEEYLNCSKTDFHAYSSLPPFPNSPYYLFTFFFHSTYTSNILLVVYSFPLFIVYPPN